MGLERATGLGTIPRVVVGQLPWSWLIGCPMCWDAAHPPVGAPTSGRSHPWWVGKHPGQVAAGFFGRVLALSETLFNAHGLLMLWGERPPKCWVRLGSTSAVVGR